MTKRKSISKSKRIQLYELANGKCQYCGKEIEYKEMQLDHINAFNNGGKCEDENFRCSCRACNFYKSTLSVERFREELGLILSRLNRDSFIFRLAVEYGIIEVNNDDIVFEFEKGAMKNESQR